MYTTKQIIYMMEKETGHRYTRQAVSNRARRTGIQGHKTTHVAGKVYPLNEAKKLIQGMIKRKLNRSKMDAYVVKFIWEMLDVDVPSEL